MPELPDLEAARLYVEDTALGQTIADVHLYDDRLLKGTSAREITETLKGKSFDRTSRHGKFLLLHVQGDGWLVLHFGMTGYVHYMSPGEDPPGHTRT